MTIHDVRTRIDEILKNCILPQGGQHHAYTRLKASEAVSFVSQQVWSILQKGKDNGHATDVDYDDLQGAVGRFRKTLPKAGYNAARDELLETLGVGTKIEGAPIPSPGAKRAPKAPGKGRTSGDIPVERKLSRPSYDDLDNASLDEWMSEILFRNDQFMWDYREAISHDDEPTLRARDEQLEKTYGVNLPPAARSQKPEYMDQLRSNLMPEIDLPGAVHPLQVFGTFDGEPSEEAVRYFKEAEETYRRTKDIRTLFLKSGLTMSKAHQDDNAFIVKALLGEPNSKGYYTRPNVLLLAVNLHRTKKQIMDQIERILKVHKNRKEASLRLDKWKYYLIVFDMKKLHPEMTWAQIATTLSNAYPDSGTIFDERNVENYYKKALSLIAGEYRKYL